MKNNSNCPEAGPSLQHLSDEEVYQRTHQLAQEERRITLQFLHHLAELAFRKLHLLRGYSSLFSYLTEELKYSGGAAHRRIQSMKALRDLPDLEEALLEGRVSITTAAKLQTHFQETAKVRGNYSQDEKRKLFQKMEGKSTREAEALIETLRLEVAGEGGQPVEYKETEKVLASESLQITFVADLELVQMLEKLKNLTAHSNPNPSYLELFKMLAKVCIEKLDPLERAKRSRRVHSSKGVDLKSGSGNAAKQELREEGAGVVKQGAVVLKQGEVNPGSAENFNPRKEMSKARSRYISTSVEYEVWARDQGQCQYTDPVSKRKCCSRFGVQIEHRIPFAKGGEHSVQNCMLLCQAHNLLAAQRAFGSEFMGKFWRPTTATNV